MFYVYILYSPNHDRYYIGQTSDVESRLERHQKGYVKSTKGYRPLSLDCVERYVTRRSRSGSDKVDIGITQPSNQNYQ